MGPAPGEKSYSPFKEAGDSRKKKRGKHMRLFAGKRTALKGDKDGEAYNSHTKKKGRDIFDHSCVSQIVVQC